VIQGRVYLLMHEFCIKPIEIKKVKYDSRSINSVVVAAV